MRQKAWTLKTLMLYNGLLQLAHLAGLTWSFLLFRRSGRITTLAQAPPGGWTGQAETLLLALGAIDALNALASIHLVWSFLRRRPYWRPFGIVCLTISVISALIYAVATGLSGAWTVHPRAYISLMLLFLPLPLLLLMLLNAGDARPSTS